MSFNPACQCEYVANTKVGLGAHGDQARRLHPDRNQSGVFSRWWGPACRACRRSVGGDGMMNRRRIGVAAIMLALGFVVVPPTRAAAEPATTVSYPTIASATRLIGSAFDACTSAVADDHEAWKIASPYRGVGVSYRRSEPHLQPAEPHPIWVTACPCRAGGLFRYMWATRHRVEPAARRQVLHHDGRDAGDRQRRGRGGASSGWASCPAVPFTAIWSTTPPPICRAALPC